MDIIIELSLQLILTLVIHEVGYWMYGRNYKFVRICMDNLISGIILSFSVTIVFYLSYLFINQLILT
jgi:hypothetical protein